MIGPHPIKFCLHGIHRPDAVIRVSLMRMANSDRKLTKWLGRQGLAMIAMWCLLTLLVWATLAGGQELPLRTETAAAQRTIPPSEQAPPESGNPDPSSDGSGDSPQVMFGRLSNTRYWLSGQANFIFDTNPPFHAAYSGPNSFGPNYQKGTSRVLTLYSGVRLNDSTELLGDLEEAGGTALSTGLGMASFPNLDIVRNPSLSKEPYLARGIIHKVFALSKDKVENERNPLSLFDELPRRRLELRFGKFSMVDFFDQNSVGSDTRFQFSNWAVDNDGAYDYAADTRGYTVGVTADYEDRNWGFRFAEVLMPKVANGIDLVWRPWQVHAENFEYELGTASSPRSPAWSVCWLLPTMPTWGFIVMRSRSSSNILFRCQRSLIIPGTSRASMASASTWSRMSQAI